MMPRPTETLEAHGLDRQQCLVHMRWTSDIECVICRKRCGNGTPLGCNVPATAGGGGGDPARL